MHCLEVIKKINSEGLRVSVQATQRGYIVFTFNGGQVVDSKSFVQVGYGFKSIDQAYADASAYANELEKQLGLK